MKTPILFSFRRCPYAIRARWAILSCGIKVKIREISLKEKPKELLNLSPKGTVPILIDEDGKLLQESLDIIYWAIDYKNISSELNKGFINQEAKDLIYFNDNNFKFHLDRYKYPNRFEGSDTEEHRHESEVILRKWDKRIKSSNFGLISKKETIADWCIWPFVRQYRLINTSDFDNNKELVNLRTWLNFYLNHDLYSNLMKKYPNWTNSSLDEFLP